MEMHAHVPKLGHTLGHWVLEGVFITVSVLLGFWVNQVREDHQNKELAARVLKGLEAEIQDNLATLEPFIDLHQKWIKSMSTMGSVTDQKVAWARQEFCVNGVFFPCAAGCRGGGKVGILILDFHFPTAHSKSSFCSFSS